MDRKPNACGQYRATCQTAWTGDHAQRAWRLSWVVLPNDAVGKPWAVYSDDAISLPSLPPTRSRNVPARNGTFEVAFGTFEAAAQWADERVLLADVRGF